MFPSTFPKTIFFFIVTDILLVVWLPLAWSAIRTRLWGWVGISAVAYIGILILASVLGVDWQQSLWSNYERMMGVWTLLHVFFFFMIIATSLREEDFRWLFRAIVISAAILSLFGLGEIIAAKGAARVESTLNNSAFLASYLFLAGFLALMLAWQERAKSALMYIWLGISLLSFFVMVSTGTRGAMIAFGASVFLMLSFAILMSPWERRIKRYISYGIVVLVAIVIIGYFSRDWLSHSSFDPLARLASTSFKERTVEGRLLAWQVAWTGWRERFFLGWGVENFDLLFNSHYDSRLYEQEPWFDRAHNVILDVGATTGIIGLTAYLMMFIAGLALISSRWRRGQVSFGVFATMNALLIGHLLQNFFVFDSITSLVTLWVVFAWIHAGSIDTRVQKQYSGPHGWAMIPGAVLAGALIFFVVWMPLQENRLGKAGYDTFAQGRGDEQAIRLYEHALAYHTYGSSDVRRSVAEYLFEFIQKEGKRTPQSLKRVMDYAILKMEENIRERPGDVKWYMYQGQLYNLGAAFFEEDKVQYAREAERHFLESARLSSGRPQIYLEIAQARRVAGDIKGMWEALDIAIRLIPQYGIPHLNALVHAIELGDREREQRELAWFQQEHETVLYDRVRDAYYRAERYADAVQMHLRSLEAKRASGYTFTAKDTILFKQLAALEQQAGHTTEARAAALEVLRLNPALKTEVEAFLRSL